MLLVNGVRPSALTAADLDSLDVGHFAMVFLACTKASFGHYLLLRHSRNLWRVEVQSRKPQTVGKKAFSVDVVWDPSPMQALLKAHALLGSPSLASTLDAIDLQRFALLALACLDMSYGNFLLLRYAGKGHGGKRTVKVWKVDVQIRWGIRNWSTHVASSQTSPFEALKRAREWLTAAHAAVRVL